MWLTSIGVTMAEKLKDMLETAVDEGKAVESDQIRDALESLISANQEIKDELALTSDLVFNLKSDNILGLKVELKDGKAYFDSELSETPDFFIEIPSGTLKAILTGKKDAITPLMGGEIAMWKDGTIGDMSKAMDIIPLVTAVAEGMGLSI